MGRKKGKRKANNKVEDKNEELIVADNSVVEDFEQMPVKKKRGRKPKVKTPAVVRHSSGSATVSKPPLLPPAPKRKKSSNRVTTESKNFTQKEKKSFYECLKENGISCLNDEPLLESLFPNRSMIEIKSMIDGFSRKAQELNRRSEDCIESDPNGSKQPIEKWFDLLHQLVPNPSKKDDISAIFIDLLEGYRNDYPSEDLSIEDVLKPDYRAVYECIAAALNGKYAKQMEAINAFVVVKLIEELKQLIKSDMNMKEMSFLKSGIWWQIPNQTNAHKSDDDIVRAVASLRQEQINGTDQLQSDQQSGDNDGEEQTSLPNVESTEEVSYEDLKTYPKLRKIIECLNPLRVPIQLITEEYKRW